MKLGLVSYNVASEWDLDTVIRNCTAAGVEGFEARTTHAHGVEPSLAPEQRQEVKQKFADSGFTLWGLGSVCEFHSADADVVQKNVEECKTFVLLARDVGARGVKVRPNGLRKDVPVEQTLQQIGRALQPCGEFGAEHGVEIWVEVHGHETQKPAYMHQIMQACGHANVGVCWNSNGTDVVNGSVRESFELLRPYIRSCHITDLWSDYPYRELFRLLRENAYDRYTLCEMGKAVPAQEGVAFLQRYRARWNELRSPGVQPD